MAAAETKAKRGSEIVERLEKLFRNQKVSIKAKDGSNRTFLIEHRVGRDGGCFSFDDLMDQSGLKDQLKKEFVNCSRKFRNTDDFEEVTNALKRARHAILRNSIRSFRVSLENRYMEAYGIKPLMSWIPSSDKKVEDVFYIQAMVDARTLKLVVGEPEDLMFYLWATAKKTKSMAETYHESVDIAKVNAKLTMDKSISAELGRIADGNVEDRPALLEFNKT